MNEVSLAGADDLVAGTDDVSWVLMIFFTGNGYPHGTDDSLHRVTDKQLSLLP